MVSRGPEGIHIPAGGLSVSSSPEKQYRNEVIQATMRNMDKVVQCLQNCGIDVTNPEKGKGQSIQGKIKDMRQKLESDEGQERMMDDWCGFLMQLIMRYPIIVADLKQVYKITTVNGHKTSFHSEGFLHVLPLVEPIILSGPTVIEEITKERGALGQALGNELSWKEYMDGANKHAPDAMGLYEPDVEQLALTYRRGALLIADIQKPY